MKSNGIQYAKGDKECIQNFPGKIFGKQEIRRKWKRMKKI
jgi:hypothetical protein